MGMLKALALAAFITLVVVCVGILLGGMWGCQAKATISPLPEITVKMDEQFWAQAFAALAQKRREAATQPATRPVEKL